MGMNGVCIALGYALATYMGLAFFYSTNMSTQWRGPYGISLIFTALPALLAWFLPESPRWLLMSNRVDDAKQVVRGLHNLSNTDEHHFAIAEFYQMQKQIEYDRTLDPSYWQMLKRASYRKRIIMSAGYSALGQSTAILGAYWLNHCLSQKLTCIKSSITMAHYSIVFSAMTLSNSSSSNADGSQWEFLEI